MDPARNVLISQLRQEIHRLGATRPLCFRNEGDVRQRLAPLNEVFPGRLFPLHSLHEFICPSPTSRAASIGFLSVILSCLDTGGNVIWVSEKMRVFPPALQRFGLNPSRFIFIRALKEKDRTWVMEEALKCPGLAALVGETRQFDFNLSRRLQLGTEKNGISSFIFRETESNQATTCTARWKISPLPSRPMDELPGPGLPAWNVELLKMKNGKVHSWNLFYEKGILQTLFNETGAVNAKQLKTG